MKNLIKKILKEEFEHMYQPTGNSCGPTCIKMVHDFFVGDIFEIPEICEACGTDWTVGTPPDRMELGFNHMGIDYEHHIGMDEPYEFLREVFSKGHVAIIRTIIQGIPHWIVARGWNEDTKTFIINDPWQGPQDHTEEDLENIWYQRNYEFFEVIGGKPMERPKKKASGKVTIEPFKGREDIIEAIKIAIPIFSGQMSPQQLVDYLLGTVDWKISVKAVVDGKVVGFYFLDENDLVTTLSYYCAKDKNALEYDIPEVGETDECVVYKDLSEYGDKFGLEGVAIGVDPKYKGMGIGKKLIEHSQSLGYDYIWGMQYESLGNIKHWLKRRELVAVVPGIYFTVQDL